MLALVDGMLVVACIALKVLPPYCMTTYLSVGDGSYPVADLFPIGAGDCPGR